MSEVPYTAFGLFRKHPEWIVAFGSLAGKTALAAKTEMRLSDAGLRKFYTALLAAQAQAQTNPPERVTLPLIQPPTWVSWDGFLTMIQQIERRIQQLDSCQHIPDLNTFQTGGSN